MNQIPYGRQWICEEDVEAVARVLRSDRLTCGPAVTEFEEAVARHTGAKHAVAVCNGTAALHVACLALGIKSGDTGVTSPLSFLASANCIAYCGGRPDFVDIDPRTYCLSPDALEEYISEKEPPAVVIPVDFAGVPADMPAIRRLADRHGFHVLEDAAHAIGSRYKDGEVWISCGSCAHSDMAVFSFHPVKTVTTGEGGMILTNDPVLARRARMFSNHGVERDPGAFRSWAIDGQTGEIRAAGSWAGQHDAAPWLYQQQVLGFNCRITDIQSALGTSQVRRLPMFAERRREIVRMYNEAFGSDFRLILPPRPDRTEPCYHLYVLRLASGAVARLELARRLREKGIHTQVHYVPIHLQPWYAETFGFEPGMFPEAERVYKSCLSLPLYPLMSDKDVQHVIDGVSETLNDME